MKTEQIRQALRRKYHDHCRYAVAEEVGLTTGFSHRYLDMMILDCYESHGFRIDGYEIKVSKSDLRKELEDPEKHVAFFDVLDYFWLACPKDIVDLSLIPDKWGVLAFSDDGSFKILRKALALHDTANDRSVPRGFLASVVRAIQKREPAAEALREEYERGKEEMRQELLYGSTGDEVETKLKLGEYERLQKRFYCYSPGELEDLFDKVERFRLSSVEYLPDELLRMSRDLKRTANVVKKILLKSADAVENPL